MSSRADGTGIDRRSLRLSATLLLVGQLLYIVVTQVHVDGDAHNHPAVAWLHAPDAEKAARFASAEAIRWIEWGMRSYQNVALGLALLLFAAALGRTACLPRPMAYLLGLSGLTYLVQRWVVGSEGFSPTMSIAIVLAWVLGLAWMIWLFVVAWRMENSRVPPLGR